MSETKRACIDCGEETYNDQRCRDCDIEHLIEQARCEECHRFIVNDTFASDGPRPHNHAIGCSKAERCGLWDCEREATTRVGKHEPWTWLCDIHANMRGRA